MAGATLTTPEVGGNIPASARDGQEDRASTCASCGAKQTPCQDEANSRPDTAWLVLKLRSWANIIAARFGHPVYLVGSALRMRYPRDIDVRVVLPDAEFTARYGLWTDVRTAANGPWAAGALRWIEDMGKQNRYVARYCCLNIDFQVQAEQEVEALKLATGPSGRIRLDDGGADLVQRTGTLDAYAAFLAIRGVLAKYEGTITASNWGHPRRFEIAQEVKDALAITPELAIDREKIGAAMHESWSRTVRAQGRHGPGEHPIGVGGMSCDEYSRTYGGVLGCPKYHPDLVPWEQLPEEKKIINRSAVDGLLAAINHAPGTVPLPSSSMNAAARPLGSVESSASAPAPEHLQ